MELEHKGYEWAKQEGDGAERWMGTVKLFISSSGVSLILALGRSTSPSSHISVALTQPLHELIMKTCLEEVVAILRDFIVYISKAVLRKNKQLVHKV